MHMHQSFVATGGGWDKSSSRFNRNSVSRTLIQAKAVSAPFPASPRIPRRWRVEPHASSCREVLECGG